MFSLVVVFKLNIEDPIELEEASQRLDLFNECGVVFQYLLFSSRFHSADSGFEVAV